MGLELKGFRKPNEVTIAKDGRVEKNFDDIIAYIYQRINSIFHILTYNQKYGVYIENIEQLNDHTKYYIITISESCETYKVDEVIYLHSPIIEKRTEFDKSKI